MKPLKNIEESASGEGAVEGDAVTEGLDDTNSESTKGPIEPVSPPEPSEPPEPETQTVDIQDLPTVAEAEPPTQDGPDSQRARQCGCGSCGRRSGP